MSGPFRVLQGGQEARRQRTPCLLRAVDESSHQQTLFV